MQIYWTKINKIIEETPEVKTYLLDCPKDFIGKKVPIPTSHWKVLIPEINQTAA